MTGTILQINVSPGGVPKLAVPEAVVTPFGMEGDGWAHPRIHGGPRKALLVLCSEALEELAARGFSVYPGALGENLTTLGLDPRLLRPGQRFRAGAVWLELTQARTPCRALEVYGAGLMEALREPGWGGFYAAVIQPGVIRPQDIIALVDELA